ncbi:MAG: family 1 encapsulin nanocompartment shell protein [Anaerolineae bacterium]
MANRFRTRDDAPFSPALWEALDSAMIGTARAQLAGRRLLPIEGPYGLGLKTVALEDVEDDSGLTTARVLPVTLIQRAFSLSMRDLAAFEQNQVTLITRPLVEAALEVARLEDALIFNGGSGTPGLLGLDGATRAGLSAWDEVGAAANDVIRAAGALDEAGFHGPYTLALPTTRYNQLFRLYPGGVQTELQHIQSIVTAGVFKAGILQDAAILAATGPQFASLVIGEDMTLGFIGPSEGHLELSITESLALRVRVPQSLCVIGAPAA